MKPFLLPLAACLLWGGAAHAAGDAAHGEKLFQECRACHAAERNASGTLGPSLYGVFGRKAGVLDDFRYSPALKRSDIVWNADTLNAYLADPQKAVPANRMPYAGLPEERDRADLIEYLRQAFK
jgi:cytochrome c2